ncbi:peptidylprolyl isomerase [Candidatus Parcubacteria bacterium]|nr:peptidylprolyl isomerase [Candidatus Parcubacteria bacterium]
MPDQEDLASKFSQAIIKTNQGDITLKFYADKSPKTVNNFLNLANNGFYDGTRFHRVMNDFMIQGGDPLSKDIGNKDRWGTGDPGYKFADEFNDQPLQKGSLAMANSGPNTNGSQFFIVTKDFTPWLDGKHTNFGYVTDGLDTVEKIEAVPVDSKDRPREDVIIESISLIE